MKVPKNARQRSLSLPGAEKYVLIFPNRYGTARNVHFDHAGAVPIEQGAAVATGGTRSLKRRGDFAARAFVIQRKARRVARDIDIDIAARSLAVNVGREDVCGYVKACLLYTSRCV